MSVEHIFFSGDYPLADPYVNLESGTLPAALVMDSNMLYGDGIFEGIRIYDGRIFKLAEHLERLWRSAGYMRIELPYSREELTGILKTLGRKNVLRGGGYIRLVVTRGRRHDLGINPLKVGKPTTFIIARSLQLYPKEFYEKGLSIITARTRRTAPACVNPNVKTCNYVNNILAVMEANDAGVPEVMLLTATGHVCELSADNLFIVRDGRVLTPPEDNILVGVTRNTILSLCARLGIPAAQAEFGPEVVRQAEEVFLTGSGAEVVPVVNVDGHPVADGRPGTITRRILGAFRDEVADPAQSVPIFD